jgi:hypothetical protein
MKNIFFIEKPYFIYALSAMLVLSSFTISKPGKHIVREAVGNHTISSSPVVILELFTSQGCSSCPPADAILAEYANAHDAHIIPLSFHVDYWNRLGWADPFSSRVFSERQQWYSQHLPKGSIYTPQLIVNGVGEVVGNNRPSVKALVQKALAATQSATIEISDISVGKNILNFHYKAVNATQNDVLNIALVQKQATTHIKAGENEGVTITNHNIVRSFIRQAASNEGAGLIEIPVSFKAADYALVVYVQHKKDLSVVAACMKEL